MTAALLALVALFAEQSGVRFYVTDAASALVEQGLAAASPAGSESDAFQPVPNPGIRFQMNEAQATSAPWIDSNGWRFSRGISKANYANLPPGSAPLAAAEAFAFGVAAILNPDPADLQELAAMLRFLKTQERPPMPAMVNLAVIGDHSPEMDEILNLLTRRNLLYKVVSGPARKLLTIQLGTPDFPMEAAANPNDFAARVRAKLGDDKRLVRLYGTSTTIAHLTGAGRHARLYLLNYSRNRRGGVPSPQSQQAVPEIRVRVLGRYRPVKLAAYGAAEGAQLADVENRLEKAGKVTEFTVPPFRILAIIDLDAVK